MTDSEIHNNIITKCINLDWLSVYCIEPNGVVMDAEYYKKLGGRLNVSLTALLSMPRNSS